MTSEKKTLRSSEWIFAASLFMILSSLWLIAKIQVWQYSRETNHVSVMVVNVQIDGFVERPNVYELPVGTPISEALKKARPKRFADLRSIDQSALIVGSMKLFIEPLQKLKIHIAGAVIKNETLEVLPGTRICQLKEKISFLSNADLSFFKQRRFISDGEVVEIPFANEILKNPRQYID